MRLYQYRAARRRTTMAFGEKGRRARQSIVDAAAQLFYERGYAQTSFSDIADAAGIPRGNFYYHFRSKDAILSAVVDARLQVFAELFGSLDAQSAAPRERLARFVEVLERTGDELVHHGCPVGSLSMEMVKSREGSAAPARGLFDLIVDWVERQFASMDTSDGARALAMRLVGDMQGVALLASVYNDRDYLGREVRRIQRWLEQETRLDGNQ